MADNLRFTHEQFGEILRAYPLPGLDDPAFREALALTLSGPDPALACYVAGLRGPQVRVLREYVEPPPDALPGAAGGSDHGADDAFGLTVRERLALVHACDLALLTCEGSVTRGRLLRLVAVESPALAARLASLTSPRLARLCRAIRRGGRGPFSASPPA